MTEWIRTAERLPESGARYLVTHGSDPEIWWFSVDHWEDADENQPADYFTHWMPLPELPQPEPHPWRYEARILDDNKVVVLRQRLDPQAKDESGKNVFVEREALGSGRTEHTFTSTHRFEAGFATAQEALAYLRLSLKGSVVTAREDLRDWEAKLEAANAYEIPPTGEEG